MELHIYDPEQDTLVIEREHLPHWSQVGAMAFITWRTWDSIPAAVANEVRLSRLDWLKRHGVRDGSQLRTLPGLLQAEYHRLFSKRWDELLDHCSGECVLKRPELSGIVAKSLRHFDGDRYDLFDYVVMPNHVHVVAAFPDLDSMTKQEEGWKHYTASQINRRLGRSGRFWQPDSFDHLIRSERQFQAIRVYIAQNPARANLDPATCPHYSKSLTTADTNETAVSVR